MAFLYRPTKVYYTDATGKRVPPGTSGATKVTKTLKKWYAKGPPLPPKKKVPLAADKRAAAQMLAELERKIERGETPIGGSVFDASKRLLTEHLADFADDQKAKGVGEEHWGKAIARIRRILTACEMERPVDLDASKVPNASWPTSRSAAGISRHSTRPRRCTRKTNCQPSWTSSLMPSRP